MQKITRLIPFLLLTAIPASLWAQPFELQTTPREAFLAGSGAEFHSTIRLTSVESPFNASILLSASCPDLPEATVEVTPTLLNPPYGNDIITRVTVSGPKIPGEHRVIITAQNGPAIDHDTVRFIIRSNSLWRVWTDKDLGFAERPPNYSSWFSKNRFALDRKEGVGWFTLEKDILRSFDGRDWQTHPWPEAGSAHAFYSVPDRSHGVTPAGIAIDHQGRLWAGLTGYSGQSRISTLLRMDGPDQWTIIAGPYNPDGRPEGMAPEWIYTVFETSVGNRALQIDADGRAWTHYREGWLNFDGRGWNHVDTRQGRVGSYSEKAFDDDGRLWCGSGEEIVMYDGTYWTLWPLQMFGVDPEFHLLSVIGHDSRGYVWYRGKSFNYRVGTDPLDVQVFYPAEFTGDGGTGEILPPENHHFSSYYGRYFSSLDVDAGGDVWLGLIDWTDSYNTGETFDGGVARLHNGRWYHYTYQNSGLPDNNVVDLQVDSSRQVWVLTSDGSLSILDGNADPIEAFNEGVISSTPDQKMPQIDLTMSVAPNPATSHLSVSLEMSGRLSEGELAIYNVRGERVRRISEPGISPGAVEFDLEGLPAGAYFVRLEGSAGVHASAPLLITR